MELGRNLILSDEGHFFLNTITNSLPGLFVRNPSGFSMSGPGALERFSMSEKRVSPLQDARMVTEKRGGEENQLERHHSQECVSWKRDFMHVPTDVAWKVSLCP